MSDALQETMHAVREHVQPSSSEREALEATVSELLSRTQEAVASLPVDAHVRRVGSTARDTWLRGERDIDIFVCFPPSLSRNALERYGLEVGHAVVENGRREYAEHPYVTGEVNGYSVDLVPCYDVESGAEIKSAVDRTPFHAAYVRDRLTPDDAAEVRILKRFCEAIGIYGSDLRTQGFSGYLTELLVLEYGNAVGVLETASAWHPPVHLDPADHGTETFDDPLVVIDPTDPRRNVAAVVTAENLARFQHHARAFLANPSPAFFEAEPPGPLSDAQLRAELDRRGTTPLAIRFPTPELVDDQLYPQLRSSLRGIESGLQQHGFDIIRSTTFANDDAVFFIELDVPARSNIERHEGPPVHVEAHAASFLEKWEDADVYGPYIDEDRYVIERDRTVTTASEVLTSDRLFDLALGAQIRTALAEGYDILIGEDVTTLLPAFETELAAYFDPSP